MGTAFGAASRVWFTLSHGIVNEIYYPRLDSACTRDLGLIVTDGETYHSEEKRDARSVVTRPVAGVPAFHLSNTSHDGRYRVEKDIVSDPSTDVVLQRVRFVPLVGVVAAYRVYSLLAPHLNNHGAGNSAWVGEYKGTPMLFAERDGHALALACSTGWLARSAGFVGFSDGWQQLRTAKRLIEVYERAENGNVAVVGELDLSVSSECVLALGFGVTDGEAAERAASSLATGFDALEAEYVADWRAWLRTLDLPACQDAESRGLVEFSAAVLRTHESKSFRGGVIASLSIPWGFNKGDDDLGGYHLVWPRDLVEAAGGFLAVGAHDDARRVLRFLQVTQDADGHWCQNMWLDGSPYWTGIQMDEVALPVLLLDLAWRTGAVDPADRRRFWPMVRRAIGFIVRHGPVSPQDRWEEDPGYSPFTIGAEIAALLAAADEADVNGESGVATYLRETADAWYESIDDWMYVRDTPLASACGVGGYYVRVASPDQADAASPKDGFVPIKNRPPSENTAQAALTVSPDVLALVRFGLRAADDPRVVQTARVIDEVLKVETPRGPAWRRYTGDGYGEHDDGSPFDGTGIGRAWPLLTGERGHYELAAGRVDRATALARALHALAGDEQLLPEQVWDAGGIPERELVPGGPTGSARPLVWAHAEYVKLQRSIQDGRVFDQPPQAVDRYLTGRGFAPPPAIWRFNNKIRTMPRARRLRIETLAPAVVHLGADGWLRVRDVEATATGLGVWVATVEVGEVSATASVEFTFYWPGADRWEGVDYRIALTS